MKKIILLAVAFVSFATLTSCSKDDESASLLGKWEYSKEGTFTNGVETLVDYVPESGCSKNYSMITASTIMDHAFSGTACDESISNLPYSRSGNTLTVTGEGGALTFLIKKLTSSSLTVYYLDPDSPTVSQVTVFKRIN